MLRDTAVSRILVRCGDRRLDTAAQQFCIDEMVQVITELERSPELPWFLLVAPSTYGGFETTQDNPIVTPPTGFLRESDDMVDVGSIRYQDSTGNWILVGKRDLAVLESQFTNSASGSPQLYSLVGENFYFGPTPDAVYSLKITGYFADTTLAGAYGVSNNIENDWLKYASDLIIGRTGAVIAGEYFKDASTAQMFASNAQRASARLQVENTARLESGMMRQVGEST